MAEVKYTNVSYDGKNATLNITLRGTTVDGKAVPQKALAKIKGWTQIEYTTTITREKFYGADRLAQSRTEGQAECTASLTANRATWNLIRDTALAMQCPIANILMSVGVTYSKPGTTVAAVTDTLTDVAFSEIGVSLDSTDSASTLVTHTLDPMNIFYSGTDVFGGKLS